MNKTVNELNVLMIANGGEGLTEAPDEINHFLQYRHMKYAENVKSLHILEKTLRSDKWSARRLSDKLFTYPTLSRSYFLGLFDLFGMGSRIIREHKIDVIVTSDPFGSGFVGYLLSRRFRKPLCVQMFGDYVFNKIWQGESLKKKLVSRLARFNFRRAATIRVMSPHIKSILERELGIKPGAVFIMPIFVNKEIFSNVDGSETRKTLLRNGKGSIVLSVGRLCPQKDLFTLLRAAAIVVGKHSEVLFLIIGDGEDREGLEEFCAKNNLRDHVIFLGHVPYGEVPSYFKACDIFVLSSAYEDTARVLAEAALSAKPIVSTDSTGASDIVKDNENGFVVPVRDHQALADKINYLLDNKELRGRFGSRSVEIVKGMFDEETLTRQIIDMWHQTYMNGSFFMRTERAT